MSQPTNDIEERVERLFNTVTKIQLSPADRNADLVSKFGLDSMQRIEVLIAIEKEFEISVSDEESVNLRTFAEFVKLIQDHLSR